MHYCENPLQFRRRASREVRVGHVGIGGDNPIRVQSMITCDTMDTEMSIQQTIELANVGCEIVRITAPTVKDSRNLENIVKGLRARGCNVPIVADIHFKPVYVTVVKEKCANVAGQSELSRTLRVCKEAHELRSS